MFQIPLLNSPLAEKRIIFFMIKKQMIGRRAYTDSIYKRAIKLIPLYNNFRLEYQVKLLILKAKAPPVRR